MKLVNFPKHTFDSYEDEFLKPFLRRVEMSLEQLWYDYQPFYYEQVCKRLYNRTETLNKQGKPKWVAEDSGASQLKLGAFLGTARISEGQRKQMLLKIRDAANNIGCCGAGKFGMGIASPKDLKHLSSLCLVTCDLILDMGVKRLTTHSKVKMFNSYDYRKYLSLPPLRDTRDLGLEFINYFGKDA